jgi:hypothetical protein
MVNKTILYTHQVSSCWEQYPVVDLVSRDVRDIFFVQVKGDCSFTSFQFGLQKFNLYCMNIQLNCSTHLIFINGHMPVVRVLPANQWGDHGSAPAHREYHRWHQQVHLNLHASNIHPNKKMSVASFDLECKSLPSKCIV